MRTVSGMVGCGSVLCPLCRGQLTVHGAYARHVKDSLGKRHYGWIAQVHCRACNKYPSLAPDFIMPHKHYMAEVIEAAIIASEGDAPDSSDCPADDSTIRRWVNQFQERGELAAGHLLSILFDLYSILVSILEQQNKSLLKRLAYIREQIPIPGTGGIISNVNLVLTKHGCGFL